MFLINVVLGFGLYIDYTSPEIDGEHEFTVKHSSEHILRKNIHGNKFRTHKLERWSKFRHFSKTLFIWRPKFFLLTPQLLPTISLIHSFIQ